MDDNNFDFKMRVLLRVLMIIGSCELGIAIYAVSGISGDVGPIGLFLSLSAAAIGLIPFDAFR